MELEEAKEKWIEFYTQGKAKEANEWYFENLFPMIEKNFSEYVQSLRAKDEIPKYDLLVIPMGLHFVYPILLIKALEPSHVYFILTKEADESFLDIVIKKTGLMPAQYTKDIIEYHEMNTLEIYDKIKKRLRLFGQGKKVAVDLTRGKRVMSAAAGMVGAFFGCDLLYIDEKWIDEIKRGDPGTEKLVIVKNPFLVFGDLEQRYAIELFNKHEYAAAGAFFKELCNKTSDPREFEIKALLSDTYSCWDSFDYWPAYKKLETVVQKIKQYDIISNYNEKIKENFEVLNILKDSQSKKEKFFDILRDEKIAKHLLMDMYQNALRRAGQYRFDSAALRFYRCIELVSQIEFAKMNIDTASPDYGKLDSSLIEKYEKTMKEIFPEESNMPKQITLVDHKVALPKQISLVSGHVILFALDNELWKGRDISELRNLLECARLRDNSIIAHGVELVSTKTFNRLKKLTKELLQQVCKQEYEKTLEQHAFVKMV